MSERTRRAPAPRNAMINLPTADEVDRYGWTPDEAAGGAGTIPRIADGACCATTLVAINSVAVKISFLIVIPRRLAESP